MVYQLESPDINTVINYCKDLCANDKIEVYDFGGKKDLVLHIYKDEDFDQKTKAYNLVTISTFRNGKAVDDTGDIHVSELDGLNVYGTLNLKDVLYNLSITPLTSFKPEDSFTEKEKRTLCCYAKECGWEITLPQNHRYTYCIVDRIDFTEEWEYILTEITPPFKNLNKKLMNRFQQYIVDLFTKFCAELEAAGYHFFYSIDDEAIKNVCDINEWMFLEDGTLFSA